MCVPLRATRDQDIGHVRVASAILSRTIVPVILVPFLNTAFIATAGATAAGFGVVWRGRSPRRLMSVAVGSTVATVLAILGLLPWRGELHLAAYGFFMLAGFLAGFLVSRRRVIGIGLDERTLIDVAILAMLGGIAGSRIRFLYEEAPASFFQRSDGTRLPMRELIDRTMDFDSGGMVWYGGAVCAAVLILSYAAWRRLPLLALADAVIPGAILGLGIGRIGCFFNGCCFGATTDLPWGMCPVDSAIPVHPTQLYETLACTGLYLALAWLWDRRPAAGTVLLWGIAGYASWRFINESLRGDNVPSSFWGLFPLTTSQATSLDLLILVGVVGSIQAIANRKRAAVSSEPMDRSTTGNTAPPDQR